MMDHAEISARLDAAAAAAGVTPGSLCQRAGMYFGFADRLRAGDVTLRSVRRIAEWLDQQETKIEAAE